MNHTFYLAGMFLRSLHGPVVSISSWEMPRSRIARSYTKFMSDFLRNCQIAFQNGCTILHSYEGPSFSTSLPILGIDLSFWLQKDVINIQHWLGSPIECWIKMVWVNALVLLLTLGYKAFSFSPLSMTVSSKLFIDAFDPPEGTPFYS